MNDETQKRIAAHVKAARWARAFARMHRRPQCLWRYREQSEGLAREAFARAYGYLRAAKEIKEQAR